MLIKHTHMFHSYNYYYYYITIILINNRSYIFNLQVVSFSLLFYSIFIILSNLNYFLQISNFSSF